MSGRYTITEDEVKFTILEAPHGREVALVHKVLGQPGVPPQPLAEFICAQCNAIDAQREQLAEDRQTLNAYISDLLPHELATLAQSVRKGDKLFTPDQL